MLGKFILLEQDKAYNLGYEIGLFIGQNYILIAAGAFLIMACLLYFIFKARKKRLKD